MYPTDKGKHVSKICRNIEERNKFTRYEETCRIGRCREIFQRKEEVGKRMTLHFFHRIFSIRKMLNFRYKTLVRWKILAEHRTGNAWSIFFFFCSSFTPSSNKNTTNILLNIIHLSYIFFQKFLRNSIGYFQATFYRNLISLVFVKEKIYFPCILCIRTHTHTQIDCVATYLSETAAKILVKTRQNSTTTFIRY